MYTIVYGIEGKPNNEFLYYFERQKLAIFEGRIAYEGPHKCVAYFENINVVPLGEFLFSSNNKQGLESLLRDTCEIDWAQEKIKPKSFSLVGETKDLLNKALEDGVISFFVKTLYISKELVYADAF